MAYMQAKEVKIPAAMIGVSFLIVGAGSFLGSGSANASREITEIGLGLLIGVPLAIIACFIAASILGTAFGEIGPASLKLAAIFLFPGAVASLMSPGLGFFAAFFLYVGLLSWLFELDALEVIVTAICITLVRWAALALVVMIL